MFLHEIAVALGMVSCKAAVFIQVERADLGKIQLALLVPLGKLLVCADRGRTGGEAEDGILL